MSKQAIPSTRTELISLYIHLPFCRKRCNYCDFNTYANQEVFMADYVNALCMEIQQLGLVCKEKVHTIYFGGGTPSVLPVDAYSRIMAKINLNFKLVPNPEISMEVNPGTIKPRFLEKIQGLGINRLSIGMQSSNPQELVYLGRIHTPLDVIETTRLARLAGFDNLSFDLMFGLPGQSLSSWKDSLDFALGFHPTHLSLYSLSYEKGTRLDQWRTKGIVPFSPEDLPADMYEMAIAFLEGSRYKHYEISNWALNGKDGEQRYLCRHNLQYWLNKPYLGIGAGAHSCYEGYRWENIRSISGYIQASLKVDKSKNSFAQIKRKKLYKRTQMQETMFMGLRLLEEGVSNPDFQRRFGLFVQDAFPGEIDDLLNLGLIAWKGEKKDHLSLTNRGCLVGNQVFIRFVD